MRLAAPLALAVLFAGCHRGLAPEAPDDWAGFKARIRSGPALRLSVDGAVGGARAEVVFDLASAATTVTDGCFGGNPPASRSTVRIPSPHGGTTELPDVVVSGARVGDLRVGSRRMGLVRGEPSCQLTLGNDALAPYAIEVDPARREIALSHAGTREQYEQEVAAAGEKSPDEIYLLELTRDPNTDWPLISARLRQVKAELIGSFVLGTDETHTLVSEAAARKAGLVPGPDLLRELDLPGDYKFPEVLTAPGFPLDGLELAPGVGLSWDAAASDPHWSNPAAVGMLGSDVWGRFRAVIDPRAGVLLLRRPRVLTAGTRQRCPRPDGEPTEEACFQLSSTPVENGVEVVGTVWRDLPEGARLYLEPVDASGKPLSGSCRVGLTFDKNDRGTTTDHHVPWDALDRSLPGCALELRRARGYSLELLEEGPLRECPGTCAFAQEIVTGRTSCDCQAQLWGGATEAERKFLQLYREFLERVRHREQEPEPDEPPD